MLIQEAYFAGQKLKEAIRQKNGDIFRATHVLQMTKGDTKLLSERYLELCVGYSVEVDSNFMIKMLENKEGYTPESIRISLCLGIIGEDEFITFSHAANRWKIDRTTIHKAKENGRIKEDEWFKQGRDLYINLSAMRREFGEQEYWFEKE